MKCKLLMCAVLFGVFALGVAHSGSSQQKGDGSKKAPEGDDLAKLRKAKLKAADEASRLFFKDWQQSAGKHSTLDLCHTWSKRVVDAQIELATDNNSRIEAFTKHLDRMMDVEKYIKARAADNEDFKPHAAAVDYYVKEAELWLAQSKKDPK